MKALFKQFIFLCIGISLFAFPFLSFSESPQDHGRKAESVFLLLESEEEEPKESQKLWFQISVLNDNFGSGGNDSGLTHGSRLAVSKGPSDHAEWSAGYESRLYLEPVFFQDRKAVVHVVERNSLSFEKTTALDHDGAYYVWKILGGYMTSDPDHFFPAGAKNQQNWFHDLTHSRSDKIPEYEYDNGPSCLARLDGQYDLTRNLLTELEAEYAASCAQKRRPPPGATAGGCKDDFRLAFAKIRGRLDDVYEKQRGRCEGKTEFYAEGKIGLGKIYRGRESICPKASLPGCARSLKLESGLELSSAENDSVYFFAGAELPLFKISFSPLAAISAFGRLQFRQGLNGETAGEQIFGLRLSSKKYHIKLFVKRGDNWEAPLGAPNDDDSIINLSVEIPFS